MADFEPIEHASADALRNLQLGRMKQAIRHAYDNVPHYKSCFDTAGDMLIIRGVNVFPSHIEAVLAKEPALAPHYLLELRRLNHLDVLEVVVEIRARLTEGDMSALGRRTEHAIKVSAGVTTRVRLVGPGTLERSQGKAKRLVDLRPKD